MPASAIAASKRRRRSSDSITAPLLHGSRLIGFLRRIAVVPPRRLRRDIAAADVGFERAPVAPARVAPAAAAGGAEGEPVARLELHPGRLAQPLLAAVAPDQHCLVDRAGLAAAEPPGRVLRALVVDVGDAPLQRPIGQ